MTWPIREDFPEGAPISAITADWLNTVAAVLNHIAGQNIQIVKTSEPSESAPWLIVNTPNEDIPSEALPPHDSATDKYVLVSTGDTAPIWKDVLDAIGDALGGATPWSVLQLDGSGAAAIAGVVMPDPSTLQSGDVLYHDGTKLVRLPKGSDDQVLTLKSGVPSWEDETGGSGLPSASGKSKYMVLQLTANGGPADWDYVRAI